MGKVAVLLAIPGAIAQLAVIVGGGLAGWWLYRRTIAAAPQTAENGQLLTCVPVMLGGE